MAPTQPNHPQSKSGVFLSPGMVVKILAGVAILTLIVVVPLVVYLRFFRGNSETPQSEAVVLPTVGPATFDLAGSPFPAYPNAAPPSPDQHDSIRPPDGVTGISLSVANTSAAVVMEWYQATLPTFGYVLEAIDSAASTVGMRTPAGQKATMVVWDLQDGVVGIVASLQPQPTPTPLPPVEQPAAVEAGDEVNGNNGSPPLSPEQTATELPGISLETPGLNEEPPAIEAPAPPPAPPAATEPMTEPAGEVSTQELPGLTPDALELSVSVSPASIYAGTFNRLAYTVTVTGSGLLSITVTLPDGVLVHPDDLAALGFDFSDRAGRSLAWHPDLGSGGTVSAQIEAINDLLHPPDSLVLKVIAQSGNLDQQPVIQVAVLETEKY